MDLLTGAEDERLNKHGDRMRFCARWSMALHRIDDEGDVAGRTMPLGCKSRLCPMCAACRRGKHDRRYRVLIEALQDDGLDVLFCTFTRRPLPGQHVRAALDDVRQAFVGLRYGRERRERWNDLVAGGLYGLEVTLYGHDDSGEIRRRPDGELDRRAHAHVHLVAVLKRGQDPGEAADTLKKWWLDECGLRGWTAVEAAQDIQHVSGDDVRDTARYVVKYIGSPADVLDERDALELLEGCKGLRQVQTFGCLHGAALKTVEQLVADVADAEAQAARELEERAESRRVEARVLSDTAEQLDARHEELAAHDARLRADTCDWRASVDAMAARAARVAACAPQIAPLLVDDPVVRVRRRERAESALRTWMRKQVWAWKCEGWAQNTRGPPELLRQRAKRAERARERAAKADKWAWRTLCISRRPIRDQRERLVVYGRRCEIEAERERWRVVGRGVIDPRLADQAHADGGGGVFDLYSNLQHGVTAALVDLSRARARLGASRSTMALLLGDRSAQYDIRKRVEQRLAEDIDEPLEPAPKPTQQELQQGIDEIMRARAELELEEWRCEQRLRRLPASVDVLRRAAELGCTTSERAVALIERGDAERKARRERERRESAELPGRQPDVQAARSAQQPLPGLG